MTSLNLTDVIATSSGLTTATTAYAIGDILGAELSWNMGATRGLITGAVLTDISDVVGPVDLYLFDRSVTFGSDNAAPSISDADILFAIGLIEFGQPRDVGGARVVTVDSLAVPWKANASSTIYGRLVTQTANAVFAGGATSIQVRLFGSQDV